MSCHLVSMASQCVVIADCKTYSGTDCRCTACNQYFGATAQGACKVGLGEILAYALPCFTVVGGHRLLAALRGETASAGTTPVQCAVPSTGCAQTNADGCSCKTCSSGYMLSGAGGCQKVGTPHQSSPPEPHPKLDMAVQSAGWLGQAAEFPAVQRHLS